MVHDFANLLNYHQFEQLVMRRSLSENNLIQLAAERARLDNGGRFNLTQLHPLEKKVPEKEIDKAELMDIDSVEDELPQTDIAQLSNTHENRHLVCDLAKGLGATGMPRMARQQPQRKTTFCTLCDFSPQGFHGDHELRRHMDRNHANRKVWICKDNSAGGGPLPIVPLSDCKACCNNKTYGAKYNAAAHLRRLHFNPYRIKRGGRGKVSVGRGGMGGGDQPPMEELVDWMYEQVEADAPQLSRIDADMMFDHTQFDDTAPFPSLPFNAFQEPAQS